MIFIQIASSQKQSNVISLRMVCCYVTAGGTVCARPRRSEWNNSRPTLAMRQINCDGHLYQFTVCEHLTGEPSAREQQTQSANNTCGGTCSGLHSPRESEQNHWLHFWVVSVGRSAGDESERAGDRSPVDETTISQKAHKVDKLLHW